jgi:hypothetical protein
MIDYLVCENCGSRLARAIDRPDHTRIECPVCGDVDFVWKDNEYEDYDWEDE